MEHLIDSSWQWRLNVAGHTLHLDALLATLVAALAVTMGVLIAARQARRGHGRLSTVALISLDQIDAAVTAGPVWARRRIAALGFTLFWFVLLAHWLHLVPAITLRAPTADINVTLALALVTLTVVNITAAQVVGVRRYLRHHCQPIYLLPARIAEMVIRTLTLSLRLFGVLFASAILIEVVNDIVPPPAAVVPLVLWTIFDLAMAVIQAYIFALLAVTYYNIAVTSTGYNDPPRHDPSAPRLTAAQADTAELLTIGGPS